jgi:hypothetical protein
MWSTNSPKLFYTWGAHDFIDLIFNPDANMLRINNIVICREIHTLTLSTHFFLFKPICIPIWTYKFQQILYSRPLKVGEIKDCKFCRKLKTVRTRMTCPPSHLKKKRTESPSHDLMNMTRYITEEIQKYHFAQGNTKKQKQTVDSKQWNTWLDSF